MNPTMIEVLGTSLFAIAVLHTFVAKKIEHIGHHYDEGSIGRNVFHYLGEVEVVFGFWALILIVVMSFTQGFVKYDESHQVIGGALHYLESLNFTEPAFVFVIMCMAGTKPLIELAEKIIKLFAKILPLPGKMSFYCSTLIIGPLLGSFITEPAAMTVTALILLSNFYQHQMSTKFKYATIGLLFVNVSIGGTLTHFAAPPVLMVAGKWGWGLSYMLTHFGYKAAVNVIISTLLYAFYFKSELSGSLPENNNKNKNGSSTCTPWWITLIHILFVGMVVFTAHHMAFFLALFIFFLGFMSITKKYQDPVKLKESLLVGFFLGGLVTLGSLQAWWLKEVLAVLGDIPLFIGAAALTAVTDNAALTYLGSLVELGDSAKYYLVSGAVIGGGLTVIANAPNPAGYGILKDSFEGGDIKPLNLFLAALLPTLLALVVFYFLPNL